MTNDPLTEDLLRELAPQVLGVLARRFGDFATAEDATQEALLAAATGWPRDGVPDNPRGWLIQVAYRRMVEMVRAEQARRAREERAARWEPADRRSVPAADAQLVAERDDTLVLFLLCCHPALSPASAIALTLRAVGGLSTAEIARAFLVPEPTMAQRIGRAKQRIRDSGTPFRMPAAAELPARLASVLHVLYLVFTEGHVASAGDRLHRVDLAHEAIRLVRALRDRLPDDSELAGLLALMLLTQARSAARTGASGELIPLAEQDRDRWDTKAIAEGVALVTWALPRGPIGPYQVQAAIAALHDEAPTAEKTDWAQILALYEVLEGLSASPVVALNRAVATAMVHGPAAGLAALATLDDEARLVDHHRLHAARAHLYEMAGDHDRAVAQYRSAAALTASLPEQRYLLMRAARLS
ncbi:RNA polymerase sigma factor, sigma-70 family [Micromonospora phaseoli]|uniref:RNA polymerase sigma factor, sigma-70 family n=1 Tax=Micromonospora phaseoli TaxID=1144548 RepID=A0A1H6S0U9_9ACTN|nr:sigma-70 family RNA polymerase sigma factor [Micromonospora phaseoli]PZW03750.1 RNA polymerase ECF family sigma subunit [Micromonospora phaseoli]GIJ79044.1 RNA polymerase sigma24 factor [Micromonospora phaseoli]SEI61571.1 RNA polymerase sigma factor, sigma-70 family [Micromonospora phaseoli]